MVRKGFLNILIPVLVVIFGGIVLAGGYVGLVPGVNVLFGSNKPRDLGITFTKEDSLNAQSKVGVKLVALPKDAPVTESIKLKGQKPASYALDSKELSALVNNRPWKYYPFRDIQIKIGQDNIVEASGLLDTNRLGLYAQAIGFDMNIVQAKLNSLHFKLEKIPFYIKGRASAEGEKVTAEVFALELGRLPLPRSLITSSTQPALDFIQIFMKKASGFSIKKAEFNSGKFIFEGTVPEEEATAND